MIVANNAVYCGGNNAVNATGLSGGSIQIRSNYVEGGMSGASVDNQGFFSGGTATSVFGNPTGWDFWPKPGSVLIGTANAAYAVLLDFNETPRTAPYDVGAYETNSQSTNPGWKIADGFKPTGGSALPPNRCDLNGDGNPNALDIQMLINTILSASTDATKDLNRDGSVNVLDLQVLANVVLGKASCP